MQNTGNTALKRMIFSDLLLTKSQGHRLAYMAVMAALSVVANMWLEFRLLDIQFSITIVVSALTGILLGPVSGFAVCYIGDLCGYFYNSWGQLYMPWVGLSTGMIALLAGLVFNLFRPNFRGSLYVKLSLRNLSNTFPIPSVRALRIGGMSVTACFSADRYGTASPIIPFCLRLFPY